jgi:hypothetical protein
VVTANNTTAPDGTLTADKVVFVAPTSGDTSQLDQLIILTGVVNGSIYLKAFAAGDVGKIIALRFNADAYALVTLTADWQRFSVSQTAVVGSFEVTLRPSVGTSSGTVSLFAWGAQFETGDVATAYIPTTTAAVSVGPVSNVPRLDYLGSTCPRLLLEPQRQNLVTFSESFDNAAWIKSSATITANTTISPDGNQNADTAVITAGGYIYAEFISYAAVTGQSVTISVFAKSASGELVFFGGATTAGTDVYKIENYGNGWYRHSKVRTFTATATTTLQYVISTNGTHIIWGAQVEGSNSAYATSYIPTLASASTRSADACSKTGISSLIGQTEGTLFVEAANLFPSGSRTIALLYTSGSAYYQIYINSSNQVRVDVNGSLVFLGGSIAANTTYKIAFAYKSGEYALYINGTQIATSTSTTVPSSLTDYYLGNSIGSEQSGAYSQALLFKTRLTNAQLAELTAL